MKKKILLLLLLFAGFMACNPDWNLPPLPNNIREVPVVEEPEEPELPRIDPIRRVDIELTTAEAQIASRNHAFAFDFFRAIEAENVDKKNTIISPFSATLALAMLNNGAAGTTHDEIQTALGYGDISREEMNGYFKKIVAAMTELDNRAAFESANSIWLRDGLPVLAPFKEANQTYYDAEVRNVDFANPATVATINQWCSEKTHGLIPKIVESIDPSTLMSLMNALYFKGKWTNEFAKQATTLKPFYNRDGSVSEVMMMSQRMWNSFYEHEDFGLFELPFGNRAFSMMILLPEEGKDLDDVVAALDGDLWEAAMAHVGGKYLDLRLPRFKVEYDKNLNNTLYTMGMQSMFGSGADFSEISTSVGLFVSTVQQKAYISVDEEGAEAAAITTIMLLGSDGREPEYQDFTVDRPFLYFIKEKSTGTIFFMGRVNQL